MNKIQRNAWLLAATMCAVVITTAALSYIVTEPWHILPDIGGDGAKNDLSYLYHAMYGKGYWFEGMNYPYGEHIVFSDGVPLISVALAGFGHVTPGAALTVLWLLVGFSYVLSMVYTYRVLLHFKVAPFFAILFSGLITVCTPQLLRLTGHYALAFTCFVSMFFYWTILYRERSSVRYPVLIFITGCIAAFLHPYFAAMTLVWVGFYSIGHLIFTRADFAGKIKHLAPILGSALGILLVMGVVMMLTDPIKDRPATPFNSVEMNTTFSRLVTSAYSPIWQKAVSMSVIRKASDGGEGYGYIGVVAILTVLLSAILLLRRIATRKKAVCGNPFSRIWLFIGFGSLLLSMGIPFIWHMEWLMNYLYVFKQFRSLGRFNWIFYYVITIYCAVTIFQWQQTLVLKGRKIAGYSMLIICLGIWSYEAYGYMKFSRSLASHGIANYNFIFSKNEQNWDSFLHERHYDKSNFQAILLLPYFHIGTDKLWVGDPGWLIALGAKAALQLHLPIMDVMMARSSWSQAQKQVKIAGGPFSSKPALYDLSSTKPFLVVIFDSSPLDPDQRYLLSACDSIGHYSLGTVYAFYPARLLANDQKLEAQAREIFPFMNAPDTCIGSGSYYIDHFDKGTYERKLFGAGALPCIRQDDSTIAVIPLTPGIDSTLYEFSCWFLLGTEDYRSPFVNLQFIADSGRIIAATDIFTKGSVDSHGLWFRASGYFYIPSKCVEVRCMVNNVPGPAYKALDELVLRPAGTLIISRGSDGRVMVNNHLLEELKK